MNLYEITSNMKELETLVESGEFSIGELQDTINALQGEFEEKVKGCLMVRQNALAQAGAIQYEISRLDKLKQAHERTAESLLCNVKFSMLKTETDKMDLGIFKISLSKPRKKLGYVDESKIPSSFFVTVPEEKKLDKRALLSAAKENPIEGVELIDTEQSVVVK